MKVPKFIRTRIKGKQVLLVPIGLTGTNAARDVKLIPLTQGKFTLVDDVDFNKLSGFKWCAMRVKGGKYYAKRTVREGEGKKNIFIHRLVAETPKGMDTDHINGDTLDNRRANLRWCSATENMRNQKIHSDNTSGFKGVFKSRNRWVARIRINGINKHLGSFKEKEDAARAYDSNAKKYFGEFARLNFKY